MTSCVNYQIDDGEESFVSTTPTEGQGPPPDFIRVPEGNQFCILSDLQK